jgi:hypothetical protein
VYLVAERWRDEEFLLARERRGGYAIVWYARDALNLLRRMDQLAQARLFGERYASS